MKHIPISLHKTGSAGAVDGSIRLSEAARSAMFGFFIVLGVLVFSALPHSAHAGDLWSGPSASVDCCNTAGHSPQFVCGMHRWDYRKAIYQNLHLDLCDFTPEATAHDIYVPAGGWCIDAGENNSCGASSGMCDDGGRHANGVIVGLEKWGNNWQLDRSWCQSLNLGGGSSWGDYVYASHDPGYTQWTCPQGSVAVGYEYYPGKNDAWWQLWCRYINMPPLPPVGGAPIANNPSNLPPKMNPNDYVTTGADGNVLGVWMQNTGQQIWPSNLQSAPISSSGVCDSPIYYSGQPPAPAWNSGHPYGSQCITSYDFSSNQIAIQHTGGVMTPYNFETSYLRRVNEIATLVQVLAYDICDDGDGPYDCNPYWRDDWDITYDPPDFNVHPGDTVWFPIWSLQAPPNFSGSDETWSWMWRGVSYYPQEFTSFNWHIDPYVPTVTISADPTSITVGSQTKLTWSSANVTTCTASNNSTDPGVWSGSKALSNNAGELVTPSYASPTWNFTLTCAGPAGTASDSVTVAVSPPPVSNIQVNSISTAIVGSRKGATLPIPSSSGAAAYCPANTLMCGVRSGPNYAYETDLWGNKVNPTIMANQPLCCSIESSMGTTVGTTLIDSDQDATAFTCAAHQVVTGDYGGSSGQLDRAYCQNLSGSLGWQTSRETEVAPSQLNTDYYCPAGSLVVGFQNAYNKNDSVDRFICAPIEGIPTDVAKYIPVPSSWDFNNYGSDYPCVGHGGLCNTVQASAFYSGVKANDAYLPGANFPYPAGYSLKNVKQVSDIAEAAPQQTPASLFTAVWQKLVDIAHAVTISNSPGGSPVGGPTVAVAGDTLNFIIEWQPDPTCSPSSPTVAMGSPVTFTGDKGNNVSYTWDAPGSANPGPGVSGNPTFTTSWSTFGSQTVTVHSGSGRGTCTVNVEAPPPACSASPSTVAVGTTVTFTGTSGDNTYTWSAPGGAPSGPQGGNPFTTSYGTSGTKTVTVTSAGQSRTCTVSVQDLVSCRRTDASGTTLPPADTAINVGDSVYYRASGGTGSYSWSASGGNPSSGSGSSFSTFYPLSSGLGTKTVTVRDTTLASNSCSANVSVENVYCDYFRANPKKIIIPSQSSLEWLCHNATNGCTITADVGTVPSFTYQDGVAQTLPIVPQATTNYTLTCHGTPIATETMTPVGVEVVRPHVCETNPYAPECLNQ
jgi:hypothetical protein